MIVFQTITLIYIELLNLTIYDSEMSIRMVLQEKPLCVLRCTAWRTCVLSPLDRDSAPVWNIHVYLQFVKNNLLQIPTKTCMFWAKTLIVLGTSSMFHNSQFISILFIMSKSRKRLTTIKSQITKLTVLYMYKSERKISHDDIYAWPDDTARQPVYTLCD